MEASREASPVQPVRFLSDPRHSQQETTMDSIQAGKIREAQHFVGGVAFSGQSSRFGDIFDPNTGAVAGRVNLASTADVGCAVEDAARAFPIWSDMPPPRRAQVMFNFRDLVRKHIEELAHILSLEHGKVLADARGDIQRGLDVVE